MPGKAFYLKPPAESLDPISQPAQPGSTAGIRSANAVVRMLQWWAIETTPGQPWLPTVAEKVRPRWGVRGAVEATRAPRPSSTPNPDGIIGITRSACAALKLLFGPAKTAGG